MLMTTKEPPRSWAEEHGVAEDWPTWQALLVRCIQRPDYYQHAYSFNWVYQYDGTCPHHPNGFSQT